uniref:Uncharacterized protein n=1 Tax=Anopheles atroparvus TaxID=41427 RepID=A0A182J9W1_ANOAO
MDPFIQVLGGSSAGSRLHHRRGGCGNNLRRLLLLVLLLLLAASGLLLDCYHLRYTNYTAATDYGLVRVSNHLLDLLHGHRSAGGQIFRSLHEQLRRLTGLAGDLRYLRHLRRALALLGQYLLLQLQLPDLMLTADRLQLTWLHL